MCGDGKTERGVRRKLHAEANAWRAVERVVANRRITKRLKGKVMSTFVTPACLHGAETLALTEIQQQRRQVCENNWVRKIARVKRADRRRKVELREYCITLYFRGRKISRKVNLKYFREKIFSRIYCSRENIFLRKYLPAKISSRENILSRK